MSLGHTIRLHYRVTHYIYRCTNSYTVLQQLILKFFSIFFNFFKFPSNFLLFCISFSFPCNCKNFFKKEKILQSGNPVTDYLVSIPFDTRPKPEVVHTSRYRKSVSISFKITRQFLQRLFSKDGELVSRRRSRIKPNNIDMMLFLNKNM